MYWAVLFEGAKDWILRRWFLPSPSPFQALHRSHFDAEPLSDSEESQSTLCLHLFLAIFRRGDHEQWSRLAQQVQSVIQGSSTFTILKAWLQMSLTHKSSFSLISMMALVSFPDCDSSLVTWTIIFDWIHPGGRQIPTTEILWLCWGKFKLTFFSLQTADSGLWYLAPRFYSSIHLFGRELGVVPLWRRRRSIRTSRLIKAVKPLASFVQLLSVRWILTESGLGCWTFCFLVHFYTILQLLIYRSLRQIVFFILVLPVLFHPRHPKV